MKIGFGTMLPVRSGTIGWVRPVDVAVDRVEEVDAEAPLRGPSSAGSRRRSWRRASPWCRPGSAGQPGGSWPHERQHGSLGLVAHSLRGLGRWKFLLGLLGSRCWATR